MTETGIFVVRAEVGDPAEREAFDTWYADEHLPDAVAGFGAKRAWRCWSEIDPAVHVAFYEFESVAAAKAILDSAALTKLIAEFNARWQNRVTRTREILRVAGSFPAGS